MASPLDQLKASFKTSQGQTAQGSTEELSSQLGQSSVPKDPASALALGATPQQAAMSGSKASLRATVRQNMDLGTQQRQGQGVPQDAASAAKAKEQAAQLQASMGNLDSRVQFLVDAKMKAAAPAPPEAALRVNESSIPSNLNADQKKQFKDAVAKLGTGAASPQDANTALLTINTLMGRQANPLKEEEVKKLFMQGEQQIADALKRGMADTLTMEQVSYDQIQLKNPDGSKMSKEQLADTLGIDVASMDKMSVSDFMGKMNDYRQKNLTKTTQLQSSASNPLLGPAERQQARQELRGAGASGIRSAEEGVADLQQQINKAETVDFNGQRMTVQDLMSDSHLSGLVRSYLDDPNSEASKSLKATEPELAKWIEANQAGLGTLTANVGKEQAAFADLQQQVKNLAKTASGVLNDDQMEALMPGFKGGLFDRMPDVPPVLKMLNSNTPEAVTLNNAMKDLHELDKKLGTSNLTELRGMSEQQIRDLGLTDKAQVQQYVDHVNELHTLEYMPEGSRLLDDLHLDPATVNEQLLKSNLKKAFGFAGDTPALAKVLDPTGDGNVDVDGVKDRLKQAMGAGTSLSELVKQGKGVGSLPSLSSLGSGGLEVRGSAENELAFNRLLPAIKDRKFDGGDAASLAKNGSTGSIYEDYTRLQKAIGTGAITDNGGLRALMRAGSDVAYDRAKKDLPPELQGGDGEEFGHWGNRVNSGKLLPDDVRTKFEESLRKLDSDKSGNPMDQDGRIRLKNSLFQTLQANRKLAEEQERKAREQEIKDRVDRASNVPRMR